MRISDWSSDVCSSDLFAGIVGVPTILGPMIVYAYAMGIIIHNTMAGAVTPYREMAGAASALLGFLQVAPAARSEERRVGKECGSACRSRCSPFHEQKNYKHNIDKRCSTTNYIR